MTKELRKKWNFKKFNNVEFDEKFQVSRFIFIYLYF